MKAPKRLAALGASLVLAIGLGASGCSSSDSADNPSSTETSSSSAAAAEDSNGAYPVTIQHAFGETTIEKEPKRVIAFGESDVDSILAFGVTPVWVKGWTGDGPEEWQKPLIEGETPVWYKGNEVDAEELAAQNPDLIVAFWSELTDEQYQKFSQIAPTVTYKKGKGSYQQGWEDSVIMAGEALGQPEKGKKMVSDLQKRFTEIKDRHPEWQGKTIAIASIVDGQLGAYTSDDPRAQFFTKLGFKVPEEIDKLGEGGHGAALSEENAHLLDTDLLLWSDGKCTPEYYDRPAINQLEVSKKGHSMCVQKLLRNEPALRGAFNWQSVLSLNYMLDNIEDLLKDALD